MRTTIHNPHSAIRNGATRPAYTLIELLVVMVIIAVLVAAALPLVKRVMDGDRVREASRQLTAYFNMAKTRAVQTGRPCGLILICDRPLGVTDPPPSPPATLYVRQCTKVYLAEVPPTYAGSTQGARGRFMASTVQVGAFEFNPIWFNAAAMPAPQYEPDLAEKAYLIGGTTPLIAPGETFLVRFNYKGPWYICKRGIPAEPNGYINPTLLYYVGRTVVDGGILPAGYPLAASSTPLPPGINDTNTPGHYYQIMRAPRPVGNPLELTGGTCIDMTYSGMGEGGNEFILAKDSVALVFTPAGGVAGIYGDGAGPLAALGTLHFLVGRLTKMNDLTSDVDGDGLLNIYDITDSNLADATSLWVSVGRATGTVTTSENVPNTSFNTALGPVAFLSDARQVATGREQMGGQ
jgi:prepilin-type N-terminal cleavage/methylation domain-containing protein